MLKQAEQQFEPVKEKFAPALEMAEVNRTTAEKLMAIQAEYVSDFVNASLAQFKSLVDAKDPKEAVKLQVEFLKTLDSKFTDVAEKELATLTDAKDKITDIVEKSMSELGDVPFMSELKQFDLSKFDLSKLIPGNTQTKPKAASKPAAAAKPASKPAAKPATARKAAAPAAKPAAPAAKPAAKPAAAATPAAKQEAAPAKPAAKPADKA
ncbi:hypothetical protein LH51_11565 [Nitrincola sp. A-D6]|nr:hypothetical protein LH51_11565 [Nitrincola sp. A-D6]